MGIYIIRHTGMDCRNDVLFLKLARMGSAPRPNSKSHQSQYYQPFVIFVFSVVISYRE
ncbi:MAG: hypothetical protein ACXWTS_11685 [Methylococcaceae bacterium]